MEIEKFMVLADHESVESWHDNIINLGAELGFPRTTLTILPSHQSPLKISHAFVQSNYPSVWVEKYDEEKMAEIDPAVAHCVAKSTPVVWAPGLFESRKQKELYEDACGYGIRSGVSLPIHGAGGELGMLSFASDAKPDARFQNELVRNVGELSCLRDFVFETSLRFMRTPEQSISLTCREQECLKWSASGKSSWEIAKILGCSEDGVNFHFKNIRRKFGTSSRQHAVVKAAQLGLI